MSNKFRNVFPICTNFVITFAEVTALTLYSRIARRFKNNFPNIYDITCALKHSKTFY